MPLAETQFLVVIAAALVVVGIQFFRMEDSKQKEIDDDLSKIYRDLRKKIISLKSRESFIF